MLYEVITDDLCRMLTVGQNRRHRVMQVNREIEASAQQAETTHMIDVFVGNGNPGQLPWGNPHLVQAAAQLAGR